MPLYELSATEQLGLLVAGEVTAVELCKSHLERIAAHDATIGAFLRIRNDSALERAADIDERRKKGEKLGKLAGLPLAVKDNLCESGERTTCASRMLEKFRAPYDAGVIERLHAADAILIGRTNLDEFAMGSSTENSAFQFSRNPWNSACTPGGSSGGSAAAVAAGMVPLAIGTDTGGSIRQPAAFCGITGLKPTYGRVSRYGLVAFASSLDQIGPMGHSAEDAALLLEVIAGHDDRDSTSLQTSVPPYTRSLAQPLEGLSIGVVREHFGDGLDGEVERGVRAAINVYRDLGAKIVDVSIPTGKYAVATYYVIAPCEASSNLARYDGVHYGYRTDEKRMIAELETDRKQATAIGGQAALDALDSPLVRMYRKTRSEGFGPEVKRRIMLGSYALSAGYHEAYYLKALKVRRLIRQDFDRAFEQVDFIAGPVTPAPAFKIGAMVNDPLAMYLLDLYTVSANLTGIPAISLPCGRSPEGLPIGLQLQGPTLSEELLLRAAHQYQQVTNWHRTRAPL